MVTVNVKYSVKKGMRDAFTEAVKQERVAEQVRSEAGNLQYEFLLPIDEANADTLYLIEKYTDEEALESHKKEAHFAAFQVLKAQFVDSADIRVFKD